MQATLVTCNANPDLDGYASAIGYAELLQKIGTYAAPGIFGVPDAEVQYVVRKLELRPPQGEMNPKYYDHVVLVDASIVSGIDRRVDPEKVVEIIDHRAINDTSSFPHAHIQIEQVGAAATLVTEKFKTRGVQVSPYSAPLLYLAIVSNTLNFRAGVTTEKDIRMAQWLAGTVNLSPDLVGGMFEAKSKLDGELLEKTVREKFAFFNFAGQNVGISQLEILHAEVLVKTRISELIAIQKVLQNEMKLKLSFTMVVSLDEEQTVFVTDDAFTQEVLSLVSEASFTDSFAIVNRLFMRKELVLLIKKALEERKV